MRRPRGLPASPRSRRAQSEPANRSGGSKGIGRPLQQDRGHRSFVPMGGENRSRLALPWARAQTVMLLHIMESETSRPRALVVDDDPEFPAGLTELVEREGFAVTTRPHAWRGRGRRSRPPCPTSCSSTSTCPTAAAWTSWTTRARPAPEVVLITGTGERRDRGGRPAPGRRRLPDQARGFRPRQDGARAT